MSGKALYLEPVLCSVDLGGATVAWREHGAGKAVPLVLLHGIGSNSRAWAGQFAGLAGGRRVLAWNAPGYEGSTPLPMDWPVADNYARVLGDWLDRLTIERCVLVGQSLGAIMATAFALAQPDRVARLVLASPASGYGQPFGAPLNPAVAGRLEDLRQLGPEALAEKRYRRLLTPLASDTAHRLVRSAMAQIEPAGYAQACRLLAGADLVAAVRRLAAPPAVMWGSLDLVTPPESCRRVAQAAGGEAIELPGLGHAAATEGPLMFNRRLDALISNAWEATA